VGMMFPWRNTRARFCSSSMLHPNGIFFSQAIIPPLTLHFVASSFLMSFVCSIGGCLVGSITVGLHKPTTQNSRSCTMSTKGKVILNSSLGIFDCSYGIVTVCAK